MDAEPYLKSADNIVKGILKAYEMYEPDGLPIVFDVQMEAEALGCKLEWAKDNPPAVDTHVLETRDISELKLPTENDGRYPIVLEAARRIVAEIGGKVALYALICGPFTLAVHLRGTGLFSDIIKRHTKVDEIMSFCVQVCKDLAGMYAKTGGASSPWSIP